MATLDRLQPHRTCCKHQRVTKNAPDRRCETRDLPNTTASGRVNDSRHDSPWIQAHSSTVYSSTPSSIVGDVSRSVCSAVSRVSKRYLVVAPTVFCPPGCCCCLLGGWAGPNTCLPTISFRQLTRWSVYRPIKIGHHRGTRLTVFDWSIRCSMQNSGSVLFITL